MTEQDKQMTPLEGEVSLDNARTKAAFYAAQVKSRLKKVKK